jgi:hypothetical protein
LKNTYQLLSIISNILYDNQILLHIAFFTPNEIVLIINDSEAAKLYELLSKILYKNNSSNNKKEVNRSFTKL